MNYGEKCHCGHAMRSHSSSMGLIGAGLRLYSSCRYCDCKAYVPKSGKKSEWEYLNNLKKSGGSVDAS